MIQRACLALDLPLPSPPSTQYLTSPGGYHLYKVGNRAKSSHEQTRKFCGLEIRCLDFLAGRDDVADISAHVHEDIAGLSVQVWCPCCEFSTYSRFDALVRLYPLQT
jgi:hypothetical protein